jgi:hypothetical protein
MDISSKRWFFGTPGWMRARRHVGRPERLEGLGHACFGRQEPFIPFYTPH